MQKKKPKGFCVFFLSFGMKERLATSEQTFGKWEMEKNIFWSISAILGRIFTSQDLNQIPAETF